MRPHLLSLTHLTVISRDCSVTADELTNDVIMGNLMTDVWLGALVDSHMSWLTTTNCNTAGGQISIVPCIETTIHIHKYTKE